LVLLGFLGLRVPVTTRFSLLSSTCSGKRRLISLKSRKSDEARSGEYGGWSIKIDMLLPEEVIVV